MPDLNDLAALANAGKLNEAAALGEALLGAGVDAFAVRTILGRVEFRRGDAASAVKHFSAAALLRSESGDAQNNLGIALVGVGRIADAVQCFVRASELDPRSAAALNNLGFALNSLGRHEEAVAALGKALLLDSNYADALNNRGMALFALHRPGDAISDYARALTVNPTFAKAYNNLGNALARLGRLDEAIASFQRSLSLDPTFAEAASNCGLALRNGRRSKEALGFLQRAIELKPNLVEAYGTLGVALADLRRPVEAITAFTRALELDPNNDVMRAQRLHQQARICDWLAIAADADRIPMLGRAGTIVPPFAVLSLEDDPANHRVRAEAFAREKFRASAPLQSPHGVRPMRLRVGYFSADVHNHAVMYLIARVLELHDRERFEIHVFSYGPPSKDETRARIREAVEHFHDVTGLSDEAIAQFARGKAIDIAVDLNGYTQNGRPGIFAARVAPLQINYLGYPGTIGASFIDYIIADAIVIPDDALKDYSECVIRLPHAYQVNDDTRIVAETGSRSEAGLPESAFVFCCFNNTYKISPVEFDIWSSLLRQVDGSVLWLLKGSDEAETNLRRHAAARGVDASRLIFADAVPLSQHLARHRFADLFLDTFNYNAHTTASDALWAGLPIVTKIGRGFAARVAASLLTAMHLPDLIARTPEAYAALALDLSSNPHRLKAVRARVAANRSKGKLFDSDLGRRRLEAAYDLAFDHSMIGAPLVGFSVPEFPP